MSAAAAIEAEAEPETQCVQMKKRMQPMPSEPNMVKVNANELAERANLFSAALETAVWFAWLEKTPNAGALLAHAIANAAADPQIWHVLGARSIETSVDRGKTLRGRLSADDGAWASQACDLLGALAMVRPARAREIAGVLSIIGVDVQYPSEEAAECEVGQGLLGRTEPQVDPNLVAQVGVEYCRAHRILPLSMVGGCVVLAVTGNLEDLVLEHVGRVFSARVEPVIVGEEFMAQRLDPASLTERAKP